MACPAGNKHCRGRVSSVKYCDNCKEPITAYCHMCGMETGRFPDCTCFRKWTKRREMEAEQEARRAAGV